MILSFFSIILWILIVPMCVGLGFNFILPRSRRTVGITYILGFLVYMAVFEVIAIACMTRVTYSAFMYCRRIFMVFALILAVVGIARSVWLLIKREFHYLTLFPGEAHADIHDLMSPRSDPSLYKHYYSKESLVYWGIFSLILLVQIVMAVMMASFDGDDAYYVVESLLAQQADVMNTILPYTGSSTSLDIRHALAVITMWIGFLAKESNVHATIMAHSILPVFVLPFVYLVYIEIARVLFRTRQQFIPVFMIIVEVLLMFGNVSIYTPATFMFMRTWQGKAMVANIAFPMIFWLFFWMMEDAGKAKTSEMADAKEIKDMASRGKSNPGNSGHHSVLERYRALATRRVKLTPWVILGLVNMFSGVCSSMGVIFGSCLVGLLTLVLLFYSRRLTVLLGAFACIVPNLIYLGIYFSLFGR